LLVEIHPHHEWFSHFLSFLYEADPGGMMPQDVADDYFLADFLGFGDDFFAAQDCIGQRLFDKDMATRIERLQRKLLVRLRISGDTDGIRFSNTQGLVKVYEKWIVSRQGVI